MKKIYSFLMAIFFAFTFNQVMSQYCATAYTTGCTYGDGLTLFQLGTINQAIACDGSPNQWYHDYTASITTLHTGVPYTLTIQSGYSSTYVSVWIDLNDDNIFDAGEMVINGFDCAISATNYTPTITVPVGTTNGNHRLRFRTSWTSVATDPCASLGYGNSADFMVTTINLPDNAGIITGVSSVCSGTTGVNYSIPAIANATGYNWILPAGATIASGANTNSIVVDFPPTALSGTISVAGTNTYGTGIYSTLNITVNQLPNPTIYSPPLLTTESFENAGSVPAGWAVETVSGGNTISFVSSTSWPAGYTAYEGTYLAMFNSFSVSGGVNRLKKTIPVSTVGMSNVSVDFAWLESTGYAGVLDRVDVQWSTDGSTWNTAGTFNRYNAVQGWKIKSQALPAGALGQANLYIAFMFTSAYGNDCYLDLTKVKTITTNVCNGSTISYLTEAGMTSYNWLVSTGGIITSGTGTNSITVQWLSEGTQILSVNYNDANGCTASIPSTYNINVKPSPVPEIFSLPLLASESFENAGSVPAGWAVETVSGGNTISFVSSTTWPAGYTAYDGTYLVMFNSFSVGSGVNRLKKTIPVSTVGLSYVSVDFAWLESTDYAGALDRVDVQWSTDGSTWNTAGTFNRYNAVQGWKTKSQALPAGALGQPNLYVAFMFTSAYGNDCYIDLAKVKTVTVNSCIGATVSYATEAGMTGYNWAVSTGGTIASGTGTNAITVNWNTTGTQTVSVNYNSANGCAASSPTVTNVTVYPIPTPDMYTPPLLTSESFENTGNVPAGWAVETVSGGNTISFVSSTSWPAGYTAYDGTYLVMFNSFYVSGGINRLKKTIPVSTVGLSNVSVDFAWLESTSYVSVPDRVDVQWSTDGSTWNTAGTFNRYNAVEGWKTKSQALPAGALGQPNLYVAFMFTSAYGNDCYLDLAKVKTVTISACEGATSSFSTEAGMTGYNWGVSSGGTITSGAGTNAITVNWNTTGTQTVSVNYNNAGECTAPSSTVTNVTVSSSPVPEMFTPPLLTSESFENSGIQPAGWAIETVSGGNTISFGSSTSWPAGYTAYDGTYLVMFNSFYVSGGVNRLKRTVPVSTIGLSNVTVDFAWLESTGYAGVLDRVDVQWSTDGSTWNTAGTFNRYNAVQGWKIKSQALPAGALGQPNLYVAFMFTSAYGNDCYLDLAKVKTVTISVCAGTTASYSTEAGMTGYNWSVSAGGTIASGAGTNAITVNWNTAGAQTVSVNYNSANGCAASSPTVSNVTVNAMPVPTISGLTSVCVGSTAVTYATESGMTGYTWAVSAGATITSGAGTNAITVNWNTAGAQTVSVNYNNAFGCTTSSPTVSNVTVNTLPVPTISGSATACAGTTAVTYSTESGMTGYTWSVSAGGSISSGAGTNAITVNWNTIGAQTVSVNYNNAFGCTASSPTVSNVTVSTLPVPTISGSTSVCAGSTTVTYTTESGKTGYTWSVSAGGTITSGAGTNAITVNWNTAGAQTVSVNYNNAAGCAASSPTVYNVTVNAIPTTPLITQSNDTLYSSETAGNQWFSVSTGLISGATGQYYVPSFNGTYYVIVTLNTCASGLSNQIVVLNVSVSGLTAHNEIKVYPNPSSDFIYVEQADAGKANFKLLDASGKLIYNGNIYDKMSKIDISYLAVGIYSLQFISDKTSSVVKIIKMK